MGNDNPRRDSEWLFGGIDTITRKLTIAEAEELFAVQLDEWGPIPIPFGALNPEWESLKRKMKAGDEIWEYKFHHHPNSYLYGVKLLRNGKIIDSIGARIVPTVPAPPPEPRKKRASRKRSG